MSLSSENNFDILLSIDKNLQYQQNFNKYPIAVVIFDSGSADISELKKIVATFLAQADFFEKHKTYVLSK